MEIEEETSTTRAIDPDTTEDSAISRSTQPEAADVKIRTSQHETDDMYVELVFPYNDVVNIVDKLYINKLQFKIKYIEINKEFKNYLKLNTN